MVIPRWMVVCLIATTTSLLSFPATGSDVDETQLASDDDAGWTPSLREGRKHTKRNSKHEHRHSTTQLGEKTSGRERLMMMMAATKGSHTMRQKEHDEEHLGGHRMSARPPVPGTVTISLKPQIEARRKIPRIEGKGLELEDDHASEKTGAAAAQKVSESSKLGRLAQGLSRFAHVVLSFPAAIGTAATTGLIWQEEGEAGMVQSDTENAATKLLIESKINSTTLAIIICLIYLIIVFGAGFAYVKFKAGGDYRLKDVTQVPTDDFSDGICSCGASIPIALTACLLPCIRWSETIEQNGFMKFFQALGLFTCLLLVNTFLSGVGTLLVVILGTIFRVKIRQNYQLPTSAQTHCMDFCAWVMCTPCVIAQEARHTERAMGEKK